MKTLLLVLVLLLGGARLLAPRVVPWNACGGEGVVACPDSAHENGLGQVVPRARACDRAGYLCAPQGMVGRDVVMRWDLRRGVLHVRASVPPNLPDSLARAMRDAAVDGILDWDGRPFKIEIDRGWIPTRRWDVELFWTPALNHGIGVAHTRYQETPEGPRFGVRAIAVLTGSPFRPGRPASYEEVRATAAHEMGHALGLGHSDREEDLMYPAATPGQYRPSARDYATIAALYRLPAGARIR